MRVGQEGKGLGPWNMDIPPQKMKTSTKDVVWLTGEKVKPWQW